LNAGTKPLQVAGGFIHREPNGVVAIDQKGGGVALAQTRLYVYPDSDASQLHVIALGDKKSQKADIQTCREYVASLRKAKEAAHDEKDDSEE
jgi:hypothetical protein